MKSLSFNQLKLLYSLYFINFSTFLFDFIYSMDTVCAAVYLVNILPKLAGNVAGREKMKPTNDIV